MFVGTFYCKFTLICDVLLSMQSSVYLVVRADAQLVSFCLDVEQYFATPDKTNKQIDASGKLAKNKKIPKS